MNEGLIIVGPGFVAKPKLRPLLNFCWDLEYKEPPYRGKTLKRSPKATFVRDNTVGVYRYGQEVNSYTDVIGGFPEPLMELANRITAEFNETPNHCIIICYSNGKDHHIPWHHDKSEGCEGKGAKDIKGDSNIYNIIIYEQKNESGENMNNRKFQVAHPGNIREKADGHGEASSYVYDKRTGNGDLIVLTAEGNVQLKHRVPKEKGNDVVRYSIIFRTIKTKLEQGFEMFDEEEDVEEEVDEEETVMMSNLNI
jgi:hypothetical protein